MVRHKFTLAVIILAILLVAPEISLAHDGVPTSKEMAWNTWNWEPLLLSSFILTSWIYAKGLRQLWRRAGTGRGTAIWQAFAFICGILILTAALISPLEALSKLLFSAHMLQHTLLMVVAAPLIALSAPAITMTWSLPLAWRQGLGRWWHHRSMLQSIGNVLTRPVAVWLLYAGTLSLWHVPLLYQNAIQDELVHSLEHATMFGTAFLFWRVIAHSGRPRGLGYALGALFVFTAALYSAVFSAWMTFAEFPWYPYYSAYSASWGITLLEDQQLAGTIMWIPGKLVHVIAMVVLLWAWFDQMDRQEQRQQDGLGEGPKRGHITEEELFGRGRADPITRPSAYSKTSGS